ncbi:MAG: hypothetical protein ACI9N0_002756 [Ilumatobacter sp.]|jgi:hypothetical protein
MTDPSIPTSLNRGHIKMSTKSGADPIDSNAPYKPRWAYRQVFKSDDVAQQLQPPGRCATLSLAALRPADRPAHLAVAGELHSLAKKLIRCLKRSGSVEPDETAVLDHHDAITDFQGRQAMGDHHHSHAVA